MILTFESFFVKFSRSNEIKRSMKFYANLEGFILFKSQLKTVIFVKEVKAINIEKMAKHHQNQCKTGVKINEFCVFSIRALSRNCDFL